MLAGAPAQPGLAPLGWRRTEGCFLPVGTRWERAPFFGAIALRLETPPQFPSPHSLCTSLVKEVQLAVSLFGPLNKNPNQIAWQSDPDWCLLELTLG